MLEDRVGRGRGRGCERRLGEDGVSHGFFCQWYRPRAYLWDLGARRKTTGGRAACPMSAQRHCRGPALQQGQGDDCLRYKKDCLHLVTQAITST